MKIKKSQLEQLIKIATLDILKELESRAQEAGVEEAANPPAPPIGAPTMEGKRQRGRETPGPKSGKINPKDVERYQYFKTAPQTPDDKKRRKQYQRHEKPTPAAQKKKGEKERKWSKDYVKDRDKKDRDNNSQYSDRQAPFDDFDAN